MDSRQPLSDEDEDEEESFEDDTSTTTSEEDESGCNTGLEEGDNFSL